MPTKISWATDTWSPITGCTPVSAGCRSCYAKRMIEGRLKNVPRYKDGFKVTVHDDRIEEPRHWRKPRRIFVCSMGDLFHEDVHHGTIMEIFWTMLQAPQHTFMVLTKRVERLEYITTTVLPHIGWPHKFPHVWIGVTAEDRYNAETRLPILVHDVPGLHKFISCEPLLSEILVLPYLGPSPKISWVIAGGESGPGRRHMEEGWARSIREQCREKGVPFHFKQHSGPRPGWNPELDRKLHTAMPPFEETP